MRVTLIIMFGLISNLIFSQESNKKVPMKIIFSPGLIYQNQFMGDLNIMFSKHDITTGGSAIWGPRLGLETRFNKSDYIIAPKIGYELSGLLLCFRGNGLCYFSKDKLDYRLLPELGLSLNGAINLSYGYNIHLFKDRITDISYHRISLTFNLDIDLWREL